eukprot:3649813-Lingulodinium_polyedra.AAC.1
MCIRDRRIDAGHRRLRPFVGREGLEGGQVRPQQLHLLLDGLGLGGFVAGRRRRRSGRRARNRRCPR